MFPTIGPGFVWLSRLRIDIDTLILKRRWVADAEAVGTPMPKAPPLSRRPPPPPGPVATGTTPSFDGPNANVFAMRRFTLNEPGPRPKFRGTIFSSGVGL